MTSVIAVNSNAPEADLILSAATALKNGELVIFPTDTVYGIGLRVSDAATVESLFASKQRPKEKSVPLLVGSAQDLERYGRDVFPYACSLAAEHWPGALTLVVRASDKVPPQFVAHDGSIALRMPNSTIARALLGAVEAPLATSSANLSGGRAALSVDELDPSLMKCAALIIDGGRLKGNGASTVVSCLESEPRVLRTGPIVM